MRLLKDILIWLYWHPFRAIVRRTSPRCTYRVAGMMGTALFYLARGKRAQFEKEFRGVFSPLCPEQDARTAVRRTFITWQRNEFEVLRFPGLKPDNIDSFVRYEGMEHLDDALQSGKGAMLLFAHFGANQMIMPAVGHKGYRMSQLSAPPTVWPEKLPNKKFSPMEKRALQIRWEHELSLPVRHINIFGSLKKAFVALKNNELLGVAIDGGGGKKKTLVNFLGTKAQFPTGAIELAMRAGCPVLPVFMIRSDEGYNTMVIERPLELEQGDDPEIIRRNVDIFIARFQPRVLRYPCHYLAFLTLRRFMAAQGDTPFLIDGGRKI